MRQKNLAFAAILTFAVGAAIPLASCQTTPSSSAPLLSVLDKFTDPAIPAMAPSEEPIATRKAGDTQPADSADPLSGHAPYAHPMLYVGEGYNKIFILKDGKIAWSFSTGKGNELDDIWMLSNGNILYSRMAYLAEVTPDKKIIWKYDANMSPDDPTKHTEIHACQPLGLDKVLFVENGLPPHLKIINIKTGKIEVDHELDYLQPADPKKIHPQFRRIRMTAAGTYLVPYLNMGKVVEYDKNFKEIWSFPDAASTGSAPPATQPTTKPATPGVYLTSGEKFTPWAAIRLKNANTLITNESGKSQIEVNPDHKIVWELKPEDLPEEYRYANTQSCTRLDNGNTLICSRRSPELVEVTPDKKVVWLLKDPTAPGPATAVQILDDTGIPETPGDSQH